MGKGRMVWVEEQADESQAVTHARLQPLRWPSPLSWFHFAVRLPGLLSQSINLLSPFLGGERSTLNNVA